MTTVGDIIKHIRKEKGLTQKQLGEKLGGISQQQIGQWETGRAKPKQETLKKIADALGVSSLLFIVFEETKQITQNELRLALDGMELGVVLENIHDFLKEDEFDLLLLYYKLNEEGKSEAIKRIAELTEIKRYQSDRNIAVYLENRDAAKEVNDNFPES